MPQISTVGTGGDYTTLNSWESNEAGSDYGAGNPAVAEITGSVAKENITGAWARGFIIRAKSGEEIFTGTGTAIITGSSVTITIPTTASTTCRIEGVKIAGVDCRSSNATIVNEVADCWLAGGTNFSRHANNTMRVDNCVITDVTRGFDATSGADCIATNCTLVNAGSGNFGFVRWTTNNCFVYANLGTAHAASTGGDHNASDDTSSPGANSLDNRTTADFANFVGGDVHAGDYETDSASALATAGSGGTFIGYALESGGTPSDDLLADDLQSSSEVSTPAVGQEHSLSPDNLQSASEVSAPSLGQAHNLSSDAVEASSELSTPSIGTEGSHNLDADDLQSVSELSQPSISQEHGILADALESSLELSTPGVGQQHALLSNSVESVSSLSTPNLTAQAGVTVLNADDVQSSTELSTPTLVQVHLLQPTSLESSSTVGTPSISSLPTIDGQSNKVIITDGGSCTLYFNGKDYYEVA